MLLALRTYRKNWESNRDVNLGAHLQRRLCLVGVLRIERLIAATFDFGWLQTAKSLKSFKRCTAVKLCRNQSAAFDCSIG